MNVRDAGFYYDINSLPISQEEWVALRRDLTYCRLGRTRVGHGANKKLVSTVWIGLDMGGFFTTTPIIFETMVFGSAGTVARYALREEALEGHQQLVHKYQYNRAQRRRKGLP